jgi:hypothetical protein
MPAQLSGVTIITNSLNRTSMHCRLTEGFLVPCFGLVEDK